MFSHNWEPATAKIVARKFKESGDRSGVWEYVADVMSASGEVFRTKLSQPPFMSHVVWLQDGEVVNVLADVRAQRAKFDRSDPRVSGKAKPGSKDSFDEALRQPPGSPPPDQGWHPGPGCHRGGGTSPRSPARLPPPPRGPNVWYNTF